ncbi:MAG: hypothetical protein DMF56_16885 [Acidobacteria bacterium]|nr:MAG: hypothetical protein DMF56_16885 [Acidobacteriota bacterium]
MSDLTKKVAEVEKDLALTNGSLNLFAVLQREDLAGRWDIVISASWAKEDKATLQMIANAIRQHLAPEDIVNLARIVVLPAGEDPVKAITENYEVEHGQIELLEPARFGLPVKHGVIITSRRAA